MNTMKLSFDSRMENESFVRCSVIAFLFPLQMNTQEVMEVKTILSEGVTNAILHGYNNQSGYEVRVEVSYDESRLIHIKIEDDGVGIEDVNLAMQPLYTSKQELERSGMGMSIMSAFADHFECLSKVNHGTQLFIQKQL